MHLFVVRAARARRAGAPAPDGDRARALHAGAAVAARGRLPAVRRHRARERARRRRRPTTLIADRPRQSRRADAATTRSARARDCADESRRCSGKSGHDTRGRDTRDLAARARRHGRERNRSARCGRASWFRFAVADRDGTPARDVVPYMGMAGHAVFLSHDRAVFAHVHPTGSVPMAALALVARSGGSRCKSPRRPSHGARAAAARDRVPLRVPARRRLPDLRAVPPRRGRSRRRSSTRTFTLTSQASRLARR